MTVNRWIAVVQLVWAFFMFNLLLGFWQYQTQAPPYADCEDRAAVACDRWRSYATSLDNVITGMVLTFPTGVMSVVAVSSPVLNAKANLRKHTGWPQPRTDDVLVFDVFLIALTGLFQWIVLLPLIARATVRWWIRKRNQWTTEAREELAARERKAKVISLS